MPESEIKVQVSEVPQQEFGRPMEVHEFVFVGQVKSRLKRRRGSRGRRRLVGGVSEGPETRRMGGR